MKHPSESALLEALFGAGFPGDRTHLEACSQCRGVVASWHDLAEDLCLMRDSTLNRAELHRLAVTFRVHGPVRSGLGEWLARMVRSTAMVPDAVRGGPQQVLAEHEAGPYRLTLQLRSPATSSPRSVYGQVYGDSLGGGEVLVSDEHGMVASAIIDDLGEFAFDLPGNGRFDAVLLLPEGRVVIEDLGRLGGEEPPE